MATRSQVGIQGPCCRRWSRTTERWTVAAIALLALLLAVLPAGADETAREAFDRGVAHYEAGELAEAATAFERAYELDPKPVYLFSWAQSEVGRDRCAEAIEIFRRYVATAPPEANRRAAEQRILTCEERLAEGPSAPTPGEPTDAGANVPDAAAAAPGSPDAAPPSAAPDTPDGGSPPAAIPNPDAGPPPASTTAAPMATGAPLAERPKPGEADRWWTDAFSMTLLGAGVVGAGVGTGVLIWGEKSLAKAEDQSLATYDEHDEMLSAGRRRRVAGGIVLGVGLALLTGGVIRAAMVDGDADSSSPDGPEPSAGIWLSPVSPAGGVIGRF